MSHNDDDCLLAVRPDGAVRAVYDDRLASVLTALGRPAVIRASHVEPVHEPIVEDGSADGAIGIRWQADLSPVGGPVLGPFASRQAALEAERAWIQARI